MQEVFKKIDQQKYKNIATDIKWILLRLQQESIGKLINEKVYKNDVCEYLSNFDSFLSHSNLRIVFSSSSTLYQLQAF